MVMCSSTEPKFDWMYPSAHQMADEILEAQMINSWTDFLLVSYFFVFSLSQQTCHHGSKITLIHHNSHGNHRDPN